MDDGCHAAAWAVTKKGAMPSIPWLSTLDQVDLRFDHETRMVEGNLGEHATKGVADMEAAEIQTELRGERTGTLARPTTENDEQDALIVVDRPASPVKRDGDEQLEKADDSSKKAKIEGGHDENASTNPNPLP